MCDNSPERGYQPRASAPGPGEQFRERPLLQPGLTMAAFPPPSSPDLQGSQEQQLQQGRSGNLSPAPPLGLKGLALHMAPSEAAGSARWRRPEGWPQNPTAPGGPEVRGGTPSPQRLAPRLPLSPAPLALPVGGRGRGASALFPGRRGGGGRHLLPALLRRSRRRWRERGAAGGRRGRLVARKSLTEGN